MPRDDWRKARNKQVGKRVMRQQAEEIARDIEARNAAPESKMLYQAKQEVVGEQTPCEPVTIDQEVLNKMVLELLNCVQKLAVNKRISFTEQQKQSLETLRFIIDLLLKR
jgi:hypothetical protein